MWFQIDQMVSCEESPRLVQTKSVPETGVSGTRTFAIRRRKIPWSLCSAKARSFSFNPDLPTESGHYVLIESEDGRFEAALLRQFKEFGGQSILYPLKRSYDDPLTEQQRLWG